MSAQPEALWLVEVMPYLEGGERGQWIIDAAAELRRLHAENESLRQIVQDFPPVEAELREVSDRAHRLEAQRDALLEALQELCDTLGECGMTEKARAAITKAEEA